MGNVLKVKHAVQLVIWLAWAERKMVGSSKLQSSCKVQVLSKRVIVDNSHRYEEQKKKKKKA